MLDRYTTGPRGETKPEALVFGHVHSSDAPFRVSISTPRNGQIEPLTIVVARKTGG